jgi:cellulose 1,4-beta-cellobiosidase
MMVGTQCERSKDCSDGQACVSGQCADPCQSDKQCTEAGLLCDTTIGYCTLNGSSGAGGSNPGAGGSSGGAGRGGSNGAGGHGGSRETGGMGGVGRAGSTGAGGNPGGPALLVEYLCNATAAANSTLAYHVKITNNGTSDVPLEGLSVRYYFTNETAGAPVVELDYGAVMGPFQSIGQPEKTCTAYGPKPTANMFCEVTLSNLMPMSAGGSLELQLRIHSPQYQVMNQSNDYSFDPTKTMYAPWDHITVHRMGALLAGVAP